MFLRQSTAQAINFGPFVDSTDGVTAETGLTIAQGDMLLSKDGGAYAQKSAAGNATHDADGHYTTTLSTTDTATVGVLKLQVAVSGALPVFERFYVVEEAVYDNMYAASAVGPLTAAQVNTEADTALSDFWTSPATLVDLVWDEVLTGATHNVVNSAGRRLRQIEAAFVLHSGTAQAGTANTITLDAGANANDDFYNHAKVVITENTGVEQERIIVDYVGSTKVATIAPPWITTPDNTSVFEVEPAISHAETNSKTVKVGLAQAATSSTITLSTDASATDDFYNDNVVMIDAGTGEGQERIITDYNGTTKVATIEPDWLVNPDTTSEYIIEEALCVSDVFAISNDQVAADNAEAFFDGTGYAGTNNVIPTVTSVTNEVTADATKISGSATAADNLERGAVALVLTAVNDASATTTSFVTDLTEVTDDHYNGRIITFTSGNLAGQATDITDYDGTTKTVTVTALTEAPADNDEFVIS